MNLLDKIKGAYSRLPDPNSKDIPWVMVMLGTAEQPRIGDPELTLEQLVEQNVTVTFVKGRKMDGSLCWVLEL